MDMKRARIGFLAALAILTAALPVFAADNIKIGYLEGMSGPFADVGELGRKSFEYIIKKINANGGVLGRKLELVVMDTKSSPQEAIRQLQKASEQGVQYVTQGNGSNVAGALIDGVNKIYQRNPKSPVMFLNYAAVAPEFTGKDASFFHFRFDANSDQKMAAIAHYLVKKKSTRKVYIIGQDYSHGRAVSAAAKKFLKEFRPDVKVVGDELHPMGKVKDFSPYIAKIKASSADTVITGNWGNDMVLLVKAGNDAGLKVDWFTFYGGAENAAAAVGDGGVGCFYEVSENHNNSGSALEKEIMKYEKDYKTTYQYLRVWTEVSMLAKAMEKAKSTDPIKVGKALEGMKFESGVGEVWMRPEDHQLMLPLFICVLEKAGPGTKLKFESTPGSGYGFKTLAVIPMKDVILPNTAKIVRP
jgi:branched-chain amino acid transport system substrate-binding protein